MAKNRFGNSILTTASDTQKFSGEVIDISYKGLGVVQHSSGMKFFVHGVWPGDIGEFEITKREKNYGFAKLIQLTSASSYRITPECPHFGFQIGQCGGCSWLMVDYQAQVEMKNKILRTQLAKAKIDISKTDFLPIQPSPKKLSYRTRAQLKTDGSRMGYITPETKDLAVIEDCIVLTEKNRELLSVARQRLTTWPKPTGDKFKFNYIDIDEDLNSNELAVNKSRPFRQANEAQNQFLKSKLSEWLGQFCSSVGKKNVLELFCGSGNFTETLLNSTECSILALEIDEAAITVLKSKNLKNVNAETINIFLLKSLAQYRLRLAEIDVLFLNPPREGFMQLKEWVAQMPQLKTIFYVSCDVSTFSRDVLELQKDGWRLVKLQPVDMYPQTSHLEVIAMLQK